MLAVHGAVTTDSRKAQQKVGKLINQGRHSAHTDSLDKLPETAPQPELRHQLGGSETKAFAKARFIVLQGAEVTA